MGLVMLYYEVDLACCALLDPTTPNPPTYGDTYYRVSKSEEDLVPKKLFLKSTTGLALNA